MTEHEEGGIDRRVGSCGILKRGVTSRGESYEVSTRFGAQATVMSVLYGNLQWSMLVIWSAADNTPDDSR